MVDTDSAMLMIENMSKVKRISVAPVRRMAEARGIKTIADFARVMEMSYPTALKWWKDDQKALDLESLIKMSNYFGCQPSALIEAIFEEN